MDFQITPIQNPNIETSPPRRSFWDFWDKHKTKIIFAVILVLIAISIFFYFFGRKSFNESKVDLEIDGPTEITSGELVSYKISYKNNNVMTLSGAKIGFIYPQDAVVSRDGNIVNTINEDIDIGDLAVGASGEKTLTAYIVGDQGNIKTAKATLTFQPSNINSSFKKQVSLASTITGLAIPLNLVAPPSIINGQNLTYILDYRNQSQQDYSDLRLNLKYPDGFKFNSASPAPTAGNSTWDIATLKQGGGSRITIQGVISGNERETKAVSLVLQKKITTPSGDTYIDFEKTEAASIISTPYLSVNLRLNDSSNYTAHLGDNLSYKITFKNNSNVDITSLNLVATLDGSMFDLSSVKSDAFFDSRANSITWSPSLIPELALLRSGQSSAATFSVNLKNVFTGSAGASNSLVKAGVHFETLNIPVDLGADKLAVDDQIVTRISSAPTFDQKIVLNDSQFGSNGPFPPKVNSTTFFTVNWTMVNPSSDISSAKITAILPPGVKWENKTRVNGNQPQPTYDPKTNIVTWDIGTLPGGTGLSFPKYEANFQISITPSVNQVGQAVPLLKNVRLDGTDAYTKEKISRTIQDVNTMSVSDSSESGTVQSQSSH